MPYYFILPAFMALIIILLLMAIVFMFIPRFRPLSKYIFSGTAGSFIGFIIFNVAIWICIWLMMRFEENINLPSWLNHIYGLFMAGTLFIGPFVVSAIGVIIGFISGLYFIYRKSVRTVS